MSKKIPREKGRGSAALPAPTVASDSRAKLSPRQDKFALLYASGKRASEAYTEAYGPVRGAKVSASRLLTNANLQARVAELRAEAAQGAVMTLKEMLEYLRRVVFTAIGNVDERSDLCQMTQYREGQGVSTRRITMPDKVKAIELSAKLQGFLRNRDHQNEVGDGLLELLAEIRATS